MAVKRVVLAFLVVLLPTWAMAAPVEINPSTTTSNVHDDSGNRRIVRVGTTLIALVPISGYDVTKRSTDGGATWSTIDTSNALRGCLVLGPDDYVYHFYHNPASDNVRMVKYLYNAGSTPSPVAIYSHADISLVTADRDTGATIDENGKLYVFAHWGSPDVLRCLTSDDEGTTWAGPYTVKSDASISYYYNRPEVSADGDLVVVFAENTTGKIWFGISADEGVNWTLTDISDQESPAKSVANPDILTVGDDTLYVFCQASGDDTNFADGLVFKKSTNSGTTWSDFENISGVHGLSGYADPSSALGDDGKIYVSYRSDLVSPYDWKLHVSESDDDGATWSETYNYDAAPYRMGARSHLRYQTWHNGGGQLDFTWMQYSDAVGTYKTIYFDTDASITIEETTSGPTPTPTPTPTVTPTPTIPAGTPTPTVTPTPSPTPTPVPGAATRQFIYGFEDWTGDADTTPEYMFGTAYWDVHERVTEVVSSCTVGGVSWTPHSGNYFFYHNAYEAADTCLGGQTGHVGTYAQYGMGGGIPGNNADFDFNDFFNYGAGDREQFTRFWARVDPNWKDADWLNNEGNPTSPLNPNLKLWRIYTGGVTGWMLYLNVSNNLAMVCTGETSGEGGVNLLSVHGIDMLDGDWHKISVWTELQATAGSGYASAKVWVDATDESTDAPIINRTNYSLSSGDDNYEYAYFLNNFSAYYPTSHISLAIDDIEMWDGIPGTALGECVYDSDCNDANACTTDSCVALACDYANNTASCDDGLYCTVNDACTGGACTDTDARDCDDANSCTIDTCDEVNDTCQHQDTCVGVVSGVGIAGVGASGGMTTGTANGGTITGK